jgi:hypothetical protein
VNLAQKMAAVLAHLRTLPKSRERDQAIVKIEECAWWASLAVEGISDPIEKLRADVDMPRAKRRAS